MLPPQPTSRADKWSIALAFSRLTGLYNTTEISSGTIASDNPIHQRLLFPYQQVASCIAGSVLELGCGWGRGLALLLPKASHYTGIDKNQQLISILRANHHQANFVAASIPSLQFLEDNTFDQVISFQVIEHIQDDDSFVKEAYRVLKPGGQLFLTTINKNFSLTRNPWHVREYCADSLAMLLGKHFSTIKRQGIQGNSRVQTYNWHHAEAVRKITRFDVLNLQYRLPPWLLRLPYELLNRYNRNRLVASTQAALEISCADFSVSEDPDKSSDLFYVATK
ncbi:class I SAM-dependent methyltransferase [Hymenobacter sp. BT664]|uniref:Class I SAM-dependent methyltransferase n=2 Tax=Hymenobacter montanus TaxID=2771359 RepID=A0A927GJG5_9BACT|nr:class I SAM-dependent methyltransferase [Hymenobacter montanus]